MDYRCRLGSLSNSSTVFGSNDLRRWSAQADVGPSALIFFRTRCTFHFHSFLLAFFLRLFVLFQTCCSHAQVFGRTLLHEFHIFYCLSEWNLHFSLSGIDMFWLGSAIISIIIIIIIITIITKVGKAGKERLTLYQSKNPSPTTQTH